VKRRLLVEQILHNPIKSDIIIPYRLGSSVAERILGKNEVVGPIPTPGSLFLKVSSFQNRRDV
jgi:hypothetical protein